MATNIVLSNTEYKVIGTRPIRHDGTDKVTGRAKYGADFSASDLLHGKVLRSPHAHAKIKSIDVSKALAYPGVKAVITGQDMPITKMESPGRTARFASDNVMAREKALYKGHPVAAVAAVNAHVAESAASLINVEGYCGTQKESIHIFLRDIMLIKRLRNRIIILSPKINLGWDSVTLQNDAHLPCDLNLV